MFLPFPENLLLFDSDLNLATNIYLTLQKNPEELFKIFKENKDFIRFYCENYQNSTSPQSLANIESGFKPIVLTLVFQALHCLKYLIRMIQYQVF